MYIVRKKIKGRYYLYQQETYRVGNKVKTRNKYIGPASGYVSVSGAAPIEPRSSDAINQDVQDATTMRDILRDMIANHACKRFLKYRGRGDNTFAEINAAALLTGGKAKHLDTLLSESGYADFDELDLAVQEYFASKAQLRGIQNRLNALRAEQREAAAYHQAIGWGGIRESVIKSVGEEKPQRKAANKPARPSILTALADKARVDPPPPRTYKPGASIRPHLRRVGNRLVYVSDLGAIKRAAPRSAYADKRRKWRKAHAAESRKLGYRLGAEDRAYKKKFRSTWYVNTASKVGRIVRKPGKFFNSLVPNVGHARSADRYVEAQDAKASAAAPAGQAADKGDKAK